MSDRPWYAEGLCFACTQCGNCCTGDAGAVWIDEDELVAISDHLNMSIGEVRLWHTRIEGNRVSLTEYANGDCTFWDPQTRRCRVYSVRPRQCRSWPFWNSNLTGPEQWKAIQSACPGAGHGQQVSMEQIERLASLIDI